MMRRRRPLARAAMIGGTAAYVGHKAGQNSANAAAAEADQNARLEQLEQQQYAAPPPQQQYAPPPPAVRAAARAGRGSGRRRHGRRQPADRAREAPGRRRADARGVRRGQGEAARVAAQKRAAAAAWTASRTLAWTSRALPSPDRASTSRTAPMSRASIRRPLSRASSSASSCSIDAAVTSMYGTVSATRITAIGCWAASAVGAPAKERPAGACPDPRGGQSSEAITPGRVRLQMIQTSIAIIRIDQNG